MFSKCRLGFAAFALFLPLAANAQETVFSGPQVGEKLVPFKAQGAIGELAGKEFDVVGEADGKPLLLIFFHARTRPAFGLTKAVTEFAATKAKTGLQCCVIFLTDDLTETQKWMGIVNRQLTKGVRYGISLDGLDGPGAYGLNRNVTLTVLVGKEGKVTANFALVQPQLQADGPKILQAIMDVTGGGKAPAIEELVGDQTSARQRMANRPAAGGRQGDPKLTGLLRAVIDKQATAEQVAEAAAKVEAYVDENDFARKEIGRIATTIVNSDKITNYGTPAAQDMLRAWRKKYGEPDQPESPPKE
jgi:hypothetical protein